MRTHRCSYVSHLMPFANILPAEQITVRLYDDDSKDLVTRFLRVVSDQAFVLPAVTPVVNRSLTRAEQVVFQALARQPDRMRLCQTLGDLLIEKPAEAEPLSIAEDDFNAFAARNQPTVDEINKRFLRTGGTLLIKSAKIQIGDGAKPDPEKVYNVFAECFAMLDADFRAKRQLDRKPGAVARARN